MAKRPAGHRIEDAAFFLGVFAALGLGCDMVAGFALRERQRNKQLAAFLVEEPI